MRLLLGLLAISALTPLAAAAQWTVTVQAGMHSDRLARPQRILEDDFNSKYSARGEAPAIGLRAVHWNRAHFGIDAGITVSQNRSWAGSFRTIDANGSPSTRPTTSFVKRTVFTSVAAVWRPTAPGSRLQLQLGLGPTAVLHDGTGESLHSRQVDFGVVGSAGAHIALSPRLRLGIDVYNYRFSSEFRDWWRDADGTYRFPAGSTARSEWVFMPALRIKL